MDSAFELITSDDAEVQLMHVKSNMMNAIDDLIVLNGFTQEKAAEILRVTQPRISDLRNGKISLFSVDTLMVMLSRLGYSFTFDYTMNRPVMNFGVKGG